MAKKKTTPRIGVDVKAALGQAQKQIQELEAAMQELVDAINGVRDGMRKESLEALPPIARIAMDQALVHAKRLGAKGLEAEQPAAKP